MEKLMLYGLVFVILAIGGATIWAGVDRWLWPQPGFFYPMPGWGLVLFGVLFIATALLGLVGINAK
jgi:hypothetical protein